MKLLFDQNLSPKLPARIAELFPDSEHVDDFGYGAAPDTDVWEYAIRNGFAVVRKDEDHFRLSVLLGCPPKLLWILLGNCTTHQIESLLRRHAANIRSFDSDPLVGVLALG